MFEETDPSMQWYYRLHGATVARGIVHLPFEKAEVRGERAFLTARCRLLDENLHCKGHASGQKPKVCKLFNLENAHELARAGKVVITPGCLAEETK